MRVDIEVLTTLLQLQQIDAETRKLRKQLDALPQRQAIADARAKKKDVEAKGQQVEKLYAAAEAKAAAISDEDAALAEKQRRIQAEIDEVKGDYRSVESRTKELGGVTKRRAALEADLTRALDELAKVEGVQKRVAQALAALNKQEAEATESFVQEGGTLKTQMAQLDAQRAMVAADLPTDLLAEYEKTALRTGGVAVARLQDVTCGACRRPIEHGRLVELKKQGNLGTCPHCHRLLILV